MIPMVAGHSCCRTNIPWQGKPTMAQEEDDEDGQSADSSRCPSRNDTPTEDIEEKAMNGGNNRNVLRFPRSKTVSGEGGKQMNEMDKNGRDTIKVVELKCDRDPEAALLDLLGLRLSGSRSVGVFVQSVHAGSVADSDGRIEIGDQLLKVESISLIGLTPDQVVRVLRSAFSYNTWSVRLTLSHHWAGKIDPPGSYRLLEEGILAASKSDGAIALHSGHQRMKVETGSSSIPGTLSSEMPLVEIHQAVSSMSKGPGTRPHTQGAEKMNRSRPRLSIDHTPINDDNEKTLVDNGDFENESCLAPDRSPSTSSPARSTSPFGSILAMYESTLSPKSDVLSALPVRPVTTSMMGPKMANPSSRKTSLHFPIIMENCSTNLSIDRGHAKVPALPGALVKATTLRHRRVSHQGDMNANQTVPSKLVAATAVDAKKDQERRVWGSDDSLHVLGVNEDRFNVGKPHISLHVDDIKHFIASAQHRSARSNSKMPNEQLPLVSFDQLNRTSPSPTDNRRTPHSGSSGQSKSSKGSVSSQGSQKLSWQCPVCLDGASRIRRTKRRMMSTSCGHVFCSSCVEDVVGKYHMCPTCRMAIRSMRDVHPIFM